MSVFSWRPSCTPLYLSLLAFISGASAQSIIPQPGQPTQTGTPLTFEIVGNTQVSAQQLFLGNEEVLYIVDKAENNPHKINGHPAWAAEYKIGTNAVRLMDVVTNTFCAGGNVLGNGTWLNVGGNQGVTYGGNPTDGGDDPFDDADGGNAVRLLDPCNDGTCNWLDDPALYMSTKRWYASLETLSDGTMIIIGGDTEGGYVNSHAQNNPTYEFWPGNDDGPQTLEILQNSLPANLYPLTFLLPSDKLLIQTNWNTEIFDYKKGIEKNLPDIPHAVRTYPAGGGTTMLPMTPANNWTAVIIFCGGQNLQPNQWGQDWDMVQNPADDTCVTITPDVSTKWVDDDPLPQGRTMGNMINLPDGTIFVTNGGATGTEGYGNTSWAIGQSYADNPIYTPILYNPNAPAGSKWTQDGLTNSTILRLYHSVAMLLPDGSVFIAGSNPNADVTSKKYATEYRSELWYPSYFSKTRPMPSGLLSQLSYGGSSFDVTLSSADLNGNLTNLETAYVVIVRTGFSTHVMNMGQRHVQLNSTFTGNTDGSGTLHVSQLPPNPAIIAPGPALIFVVVNGVPSVGKMVMLGNGVLGKQPILDVAELPVSSLPLPTDDGNSKNSNKNAASSRIGGGLGLSQLLVLALVSIGMIIR